MSLDARRAFRRPFDFFAKLLRSDRHEVQRSLERIGLHELRARKFDIGRRQCRGHLNAATCGEVYGFGQPVTPPPLGAWRAQSQQRNARAARGKSPAR